MSKAKKANSRNSAKANASARANAKSNAKKNKVFQARVFYLVLIFVFTYLLGSFLYDFISWVILVIFV